MDNKPAQQAHWKWVADWGNEKFDGWLIRWEKELNDLTGGLDYTGMVTLNIGGGPIPLRFKGAREEILLDNNADFFKDMYPIKYREGMNILNEDIETTSIGNSYVDLIYCRKTLEYIENWQKAIDEMVRVIKPNGFIILMFHQKQSDGINLNLLDRFELANYIGSKKFGVHSYMYDDQTTFTQIVAVKNA